MKDISDEKILKLIEEQKFLKSLLEQTGYSQEELFNRINSLINKGYQIETSYFNDRGIKFTWHKGFPDKKDGTSPITINLNKNYFNFIAISDLHFSSSKENSSILYYI